MDSTAGKLAIATLARLRGQTPEEAKASYIDAVTKYENGEPLDGSIIVVLMIISIVVSVTRLILDHCVDEKEFVKTAVHAPNDGRYYAHVLKHVARATRKQQRRFPLHPLGTTPMAINEAMFCTLREDTDPGSLKELFDDCKSAAVEDPFIEDNEIRL